MIKRTERGWAGHFCAASSCLFRRNTLLQSNTESIVVSTVGNYFYDKALHEIGFGRYYETMAFYSLDDDKRYHDADEESRFISIRNGRLLNRALTTWQTICTKKSSLKSQN